MNKTEAIDYVIGELNRLKEEENTVTVKYWTRNTWPYSIDDEPKDGHIELRAIKVDKSELFNKNGKKYYRLTSGHGVWTDLLVE